MDMELEPVVCVFPHDKDFEMRQGSNVLKGVMQELYPLYQDYFMKEAEPLFTETDTKNWQIEIVLRVDEMGAIKHLPTNRNISKNVDEFIG